MANDSSQSMFNSIDPDDLFTTPGTNMMPRSPGADVSSNQTECELDRRTFRQVQLFAVSIVTPVHLFLTVALVLYRKSAKSKSVNIYANNVVHCNTVTSMWRFYVVFTTYFGVTQAPAYGPGSDLSHSAASIWWLTQKTIFSILFIVTAGAIGLVILQLRINLFRVHNAVAGINTDRDERKDTPLKSSIRVSPLKSFYQWKKKHPRSYAAILIGITWLLPFIVGISTVYNSQCLSQCVCLYEYRPSNHSELVCPPADCSIAFRPLATSTILVGGFLWMTYIVLVMILLLRSRIDFQLISAAHHSHQECSSSAGSKRCGGGESSDRDDEEENSDEEIPPRWPRPLVDDDDEFDDAEKATSSSFRNVKRLSGRCAARSGSLFMQSLKRNLLVLLVIAAVHALGAGALVIPGVVTSLTASEAFTDADLMLIPAYLLPPLSEIVSSVLLVVTMPGLKSAVSKLVVKLCKLAACSCLGRS